MTGLYLIPKRCIRCSGDGCNECNYTGLVLWDQQPTDSLNDLKESIKLLQTALKKAMLWTDEENDVGEWRSIAREALRKTGSSDT